MKRKILNIGKFLGSALVHLAALSLIYKFWLPIAQWYWEKLPSRGIDLYNSMTYVAYLLRHQALKGFSWKYIWYEGSPFGVDYSSLWWYTMAALAKIYGLMLGIQIHALVSVFLYLILAYFFFYELSKNYALSVVLSIAAAYSVNLYAVLVWGGSLPYLASESFLPLCLFLLVRYFHTRNKRWLSLASLAAGIGMLGHPQPFVSYIVPISFLLVLLWSDKNISFFSFKKVKVLFSFLLLACLVALPEIYRFIFFGFQFIFAVLPGVFGFAPREKGAITGSGELQIENLDVAAWARRQVNFFFTDTNYTFWALLAVAVLLFVIVLLFRKYRVRAILFTLPFLAIPAYVFGYIYLLSRGINLFHGGWYKVFWPLPVVIGGLIAAFWGKVQEAPGERLDLAKTKWKVTSGVIVFLFNVVFGVLGFFLLPQYSEGVLERIEAKSQASSAFPDILNVRTQTGDAQKDLKLTPSWLEVDSKDYRLYEIDATVNIWWNSRFDLPLTRGYIDPPLYEQTGGIFWLNAALGRGTKGNSSLVDDWGVPEDVAKDNARFLFDWYATKYLEGNHLSETVSMLAPYVTSEEFVKNREIVEVAGGLLRYSTASGKEEWHSENIKTLNYYEIKDELVSSIMAATNAPAVLVIGSEEGYDSLSRFLGQFNLNSQKIILVRGPKFIDEVKLSELNNFEAVILYFYDYHKHDKAWKLIETYLEKGGKVLIETGAEAKESDSVNLPEKFSSQLPAVFPIRRTTRQDLGKDWEIKVIKSQLTSGIDFDQFSPLDFDGKPWNISYPPSAEDVSEESKVILKNKGFPVIVSGEVGSGKVIWSGLNLPYHLIRDHNVEEGKFLVNILSELVELKIAPKPEYRLDWVSAEKRVVETPGAKGVIFKENAFPGWIANFRGEKGKTKLKIYQVGPSNPGFMYVFLPEAEKALITFTFRSDPKIYFYFAVSLLTIFYLLDEIFLKGKLLWLINKWRRRLVGKKVSSWWGKEDEY